MHWVMSQDSQSGDRSRLHVSGREVEGVVGWRVVGHPRVVVFVVGQNLEPQVSSRRTHNVLGVRLSIKTFLLFYLDCDENPQAEGAGGSWCPLDQRLGGTRCSS